MAITISGENNNDRILAADGVIDQISGINIVGLITASHINVGSNIQLGNAGIITATTFVGNLTGNVNSTSPLLLQTGGSERFRITSDNALGIAGANYGSSGQVLTSGGSGSAVTWSAIPTQVTIANNADNRVITGGSGVNLNGEQYLTYSSQSSLNNTDGNGTSYLGGNYLNLKRSTGDVNYINAPLADAELHISADENLVFKTVHTADFNSTERLRIDSSGRVLIGSSSNNTSNKVGDSALQVYTSDQKHPAIRTTAPNANGYTMFSDAYKSDESQVNIGVSYSSAKLVLSTSVKPSDTADNTYLSSQDTFSARPCALTMNHQGVLQFLNTTTNATTTTDSAVSLTERFRISHEGQVRAGDESSSNRTSYRHQFSSTAGAGDVLSLQNPSNSDGQGIGLGFWARNTNNAAIEVAKIKAVADETQANSTQKGSLQFLTNIGASMGERMRITNAGQLYLQANTASGYTAEFRQTHADNPAWIDINSPTDNDLRPAYIQLSRASSKKWGIGQVYSPTSAGSFHIGTGSHSQSNSKFTITTAGRIGVGNVDPGGTPNGSIDITTTDNTTGHGVLTDQRGRSSLVIRNKSGTLYSYSQLMFTNGNDGYNSATFLRHTKGGYLQNENFIGDLILMTRVAGNGSANPDFREKTIWPGGTTKAKQVWWANGTGQQGNATHMGWHHMAEQNPQGNDQYQYFTLDLGAASYSRAGLARYVILWNTGHASGTGHQTGEFRWFNHHSSTTCNILEHIILRRGYNNGSYYGWNDAPRMALFHSSNTGNDACIHLRCQGRRSSGYDMGLYVSVFIDLYAPKSSNGNVTPTLRARGTSAPSGISGSEFTNDGRNASYVSYQDAAPDLTANP